VAGQFQSTTYHCSANTFATRISICHDIFNQPRRPVGMGNTISVNISSSLPSSFASNKWQLRIFVFDHWLVAGCTIALTLPLIFSDVVLFLDNHPQT